MLPRNIPGPPVERVQRNYVRDILARMDGHAVSGPLLKLGIGALLAVGVVAAVLLIMD